ncbi:MAG TPA: carboxypeptidase-like regulatory domain-containing protein, partial [Candidatus Sulfotelmatobacter sp.]|nr:carboxypeptidase-like regulatory domain-containing protein [Candidatus Sulfotelmatobacter sp.]
MRKLAATLLGMLLMTVLGTVALGQAATGAVNGTVTDTSGAVIPTATVTLVNTDTNVQQKVQTDATGAFIFVNVTPGNYSLHVEAAGFKSWTTSFAVGVSQTVTQSASLAVGAVSQTVQVSSTAQLLEPTTTELGSVIGQRSVHDLPLNGRNFTQLLILTPGASPISTGQGAKLGDQDGTTSAIPNSAFYQPALQ